MTRTEVLPLWSPQLRGASITLWNDLIDNLEIGICEYDMTDRILAALPCVGDRFWGSRTNRSYESLQVAADILGIAPGTDPLDQQNEELAGPSYDISFDVYWNGGTKEGEPVVFSVERGGNTYEFSLYQEDGKIGFSREFYSISLDAVMPKRKWVSIRIVGKKDQTALYMDGTLITTAGSSEPYAAHATAEFPLRSGSSFDGIVRNLKVIRQAR